MNGPPPNDAGRAPGPPTATGPRFAVAPVVLMWMLHQGALELWTTLTFPDDGEDTDHFQDGGTPL